MVKARAIRNERRDAVWYDASACWDGLRSSLRAFAACFSTILHYVFCVRRMNNHVRWCRSVYIGQQYARFAVGLVLTMVKTFRIKFY